MPALLFYAVDWARAMANVKKMLNEDGSLVFDNLKNESRGLGAAGNDFETSNIIIVFFSCN